MQAYYFLIFVVILGVLLMQTLLRRQEGANLRHTGIQITAIVTNVVHERVQIDPGTTALPATTTPSAPSVASSASAGAAVPVYADRWHIECMWTEPRTGAVYTFRSDGIDETSAGAYIPGSHITVLMLPHDPERYFVEISEQQRTA